MRKYWRKSKYKAKPTVVDGIRFDSKKEAEHYTELKFLERIKEIINLELQPRFEIRIKDTKIGHYVADFRYTTKDGVDTVVDVKGYPTPLYKWKKKCFLAMYPELTFKEIK